MSTEVQNHRKKVICIVSFMKRIKLWWDWQRKKRVKNVFVQKVHKM